MQNQLNSQYTQQMQQPVYQPYPAPSVGAVNIQIFNPTANPIQQPNQGFYQQTPCYPYPCNYNNMSFQPPLQQQPQQIAPSNQGQNADVNALNDMNLNANNNGVAAKAEGEKGQKTENTPKGPVVPLTDDYIKTLENYLNSQDKKIRLMGAKELFERFKEDESRLQDPALTALLNKTLQDPAETVKFVGLTALDAGYALGNNETAQILANMQNSTSNYGEDASLASKILLKMSANQAKIDGGQNLSAPSELNNNQQPQKQEAAPLEQNNLNKMPNGDGILMTKDALPVAAGNQANQQNQPNQAVK